MNRPIKNKVLIVAGGTGGHIFPGLALAQYLQQQNNVEIIWVGTLDSMESRIIPKHQIPMEYIDIKGIRGKGLSTLLMAPIKIVKALLQAREMIHRVQPQLIIGMGGFVSGPVGLAAKLSSVPLIIHEQNSIPGISNKLLNLVANLTLCAFPSALALFWKKKTLHMIGNPVRHEIVSRYLNDRIKQNDDEIRVLVLGGSLGAQQLNQLLPVVIRQWAEKIESNISVHHQLGKGKSLSLDLKSLNNEKLQYQAEEFIDDMAKAYAWSNLVICRAGALTISELCCVAKASILIPYPYAVDDHQSENARYLQQAGAAILIRESELNEQNLLTQLMQLDSDKLTSMGARAKTLAKPNAVENIAQLCHGFLHHAMHENIAGKGS